MRVTVKVVYGSNLDLVRKTALEVAASIHGAVTKPAPFVVFSELGDSGIQLKIYFWIDMKLTDYLAALDALVVGVDAAFRKEGIQVAYPVQNVMLQK